jgi:hypothetical protein
MGAALITQKIERQETPSVVEIPTTDKTLIIKVGERLRVMSKCRSSPELYMICHPERSACEIYPFPE